MSNEAKYPFSVLGPILMDGESIQQALPFRHAGVGIFNLAYSK